MVVNEDKFQAEVSNNKREAKYKLTIDNDDVKSTKLVKVLYTVLLCYKNAEQIVSLIN